MAHVGKDYPYAPCRDLAQADDFTFVYPPPNRLSLFDFQLDAFEGSTSELGPIVSNQCVYSYTDGYYAYTWEFVSGGLTITLTFWSYIENSNPNDLRLKLYLTIDGHDYGLAINQNVAWASNADANLDAFWGAGGSDPDDAGMDAVAFATTWADTP